MSAGVDVKPDPLEAMVLERSNRTSRSSQRRGSIARAYTKARQPINGLLGICLALGLWELLSATGAVSSFFISSPVGVAHSLATYVQGPSAWLDVKTSGEEFLLGYLVAILVGIPGGAALGWSHVLREFVDPMLNYFYATPLIAIAPLFIVWFGIGLLSHVAIVFLLAFFPVIINTSIGVRTVDRSLIDMGRAFGASQLKVFLWIVIPAAVPSILTGLRLSAGVGLVGMVVAEFVAASAGVGFMINSASQNLDAGAVFAGVFIIAGFGVVLIGGLKLLESHFDRWRIASSSH